jgi:hypothetical protein
MQARLNIRTDAAILSRPGLALDRRPHSCWPLIPPPKVVDRLSKQRQSPDQSLERDHLARDVLRNGESDDIGGCVDIAD